MENTFETVEIELQETVVGDETLPETEATSFEEEEAGEEGDETESTEDTTEEVEETENAEDFTEEVDDNATDNVEQE